jgi:hypothetical protein
MSILRNIRGALAVLLATVTFGVTGSTVQAGHYCSKCHYEWVVTYVPQHVPHTRIFTEYDYYGSPHYVTRTYWKIVQVPVKKWALVCY